MSRWGRCAPLSRHKAAPTGIPPTHRAALHLWERPCVAKGLRSSPNDFSLNLPARRVLKR
ncbi:hypothetical protein RK21_01596 [Pseudomonas plecoglossicida]|nr:hypothetical protein RK21_01596 [Pseudomonas plecoglossicida]